MKLINSLLYTLLFIGIASLGTTSSTHALSVEDKCQNLLNGTPALATPDIIHADPTDNSQIGLVSTHAKTVIQTVQILAKIYPNKKSLSDAFRRTVNTEHFVKMYELCEKINNWIELESAQKIKMNTQTINNDNANQPYLLCIQQIKSLLDSAFNLQNARIDNFALEHFSLFDCSENMIQALENAANMAMPDTSWTTKIKSLPKKSYQFATQSKILMPIFVTSLAVLYYQNPEIFLAGISSLKNSTWQIMKNIYSQPTETFWTAYNYTLTETPKMFNNTRDFLKDELVRGLNGTVNWLNS